MMKWIDEREGRQAPPSRRNRAALGEHLARQDFRKGVSEFAKKSGGGYEVAVDESFELNGKDSARCWQGEGGQRRPLPRRRHLPDYNHHAPPVRDLGHVPQGDELRRARQREAGAEALARRRRIRT